MEPDTVIIKIPMDLWVPRGAGGAGAGEGRSEALPAEKFRLPRRGGCRAFPGQLANSISRAQNFTNILASNFGKRCYNFINILATKYIGPFSAISTLTFASGYSFCSIL